MTASMNGNLDVSMRERVLVTAREGQREATALVNECFGNAVVYLEALGKAERPTDYAIANLELVKMSLALLTKGVERASLFTASLTPAASAAA